MARLAPRAASILTLVVAGLTLGAGEVQAQLGAASSAARGGSSSNDSSSSSDSSGGDGGTWSRSDSSSDSDPARGVSVRERRDASPGWAAFRSEARAASELINRPRAPRSRRIASGRPSNGYGDGGFAAYGHHIDDPYYDDPYYDEPLYTTVVGGSEPLTTLRRWPGHPGPDNGVGGIIGLEGGWVIPEAGRFTGRGRLIFDFGLEGELEYSMYGQPAVGGWLWIALGRLGVGYGFFREGPLQVRVLAGLRHMGDPQGHLFGADVGGSLDLILGDGFMLSAEGRFGWVGAAMILQLRATLGYLLTEGFELSVGYEHIALVPVNGAAGAELTGPFLGARIYL